MRPDPAAPYDLRTLAYGDHVLVWSFRALASGRWACPLIAREYARCCGVDAETARHAVRLFAGRVGGAARRVLAISPPGLLGVTRDEQQILAVYAAAQADDEARASAHLRWLLAGPVDAALYPLAGITALALARHGHRLGPAAGADEDAASNMGAVA